jgi:ribosome-binding factor A
VSKSSRNVRVNELLRQELSVIMHTRFQKESVDITLTEVDVAPDHRTAHVYYSVIGDERRVAAVAKWLSRYGRTLQSQLARKVVLKHTPRLTFQPDGAVVRGNRILEILDRISEEDQARAKATAVSKDAD